jgi:hypothetical protein
MTKCDYTLYVYKTDRRYKAGERLVSTTVWRDRSEAEMKRLTSSLDIEPDHRYEYFPTMVTVKNLMTGQDVQIDRDTPWCCNPASESYWSN